MSIKLKNSKYNEKDLKESVFDILNKNSTLALATIKNNTSYINTAHFGFNEDLELFILTLPSSQHTKNADINNSVAVAVWTEPKALGQDLQGLQLFGKYEKVEDNDLITAIRAYSIHNLAFSSKSPEDLQKIESKFYKISIYNIKLIDEFRFGKRNYIDIEVER